MRNPSKTRVCTCGQIRRLHREYVRDFDKTSIQQLLFHRRLQRRERAHVTHPSVIRGLTQFQEELQFNLPVIYCTFLVNN